MSDPASRTQRAAESISRPWARIAAAAVTSVAAAACVVWFGLAPDSSLVQTGIAFALALFDIGLSTLLVATCWLLVQDHPTSAVGVSILALAWLLPGLAEWTHLPAHARAYLLAAAPLAVFGIALLTSGWHSLRRPQQTPLIAALCLTLAAAVVHVLGYDPFFDPACSQTCASSPAILAGVVSSRQAVGISAALTLLAASAAVVAVLRSRVASAPRLSASLVAIAFVAVAALVSFGWWGRAGAESAAGVLQSLGAATVAGAALLAVLHARRVRRNVLDVVDQLSASPTATWPQESVTAVHFAVPDDERWVDAGGQQVTVDELARCAVLSDGHGPAVRLVLGRWGTSDQVLASIAPAARLALENVRLHAAGLVHLADVQAAQRRIIEATDLERRRIERDLHDGAQQRLVAVTMRLSSARNRSGASSPAALADVETHVRAALQALRDLSHDSFVAALSTGDLETDVEELVARTPLNVDVRTNLTARSLPPPVVMAAFVTVAAGLDNVVKHADVDHASVTVMEEGDELTVRVTDSGRGGAVLGAGLTEVADRVGALGGRFEVADIPAGGTIVSARLPCAS